MLMLCFFLSLLCFALCFNFYFATGGTVRTWIVGDSIINWAGQRQPQLGGAGMVFWSGIGGARIAGVANRLKRCLNKRPFPTTLILHLGTNDIFASHIHEIRQRVEATLSDVRNLLPSTRILWSKILPRCYFHNGHRRGAGPRAARNINKYATRIARNMPNTHVISHAQLFPVSAHQLFRFDGLHLSEEGLTLFRSHLETAINFFNMCPEELEYPKRIVV